MKSYERLGEGSEFHKAAKRGNTLQILPADDSLECLRQFQDIVAEAETDPDNEGYQVKTHKCHDRSIPGWVGPIYDFALIFFE